MISFKNLKDTNQIFKILCTKTKQNILKHNKSKMILNLNLILDLKMMFTFFYFMNYF